MTILTEKVVVNASRQVAAEAREDVTPTFEAAFGEYAASAIDALVDAMVENNRPPTPIVEVIPE